MTLAISIIGGAAVLAAALALFFWQRQKRAVWTRYRKAAQRIIREEYLDASIGKTEYGAARPVPRKLMVALEIKGARGKGYVFDPEREIRIGRSLECVYARSSERKLCVCGTGSPGIGQCDQTLYGSDGFYRS